MEYLHKRENWIRCRIEHFTFRFTFRLLSFCSSLCWSCWNAIFKDKLWKFLPRFLFNCFWYLLQFFRIKLQRDSPKGFLKNICITFQLWILRKGKNYASTYWCKLSNKRVFYTNPYINFNQTCEKIDFWTAVFSNRRQSLSLI